MTFRLPFQNRKPPSHTSQGATPFWRDERVLRIVAQIISAIVILGLLYWAITNVLSAANQRGLELGFRFLSDSAGFPIGESPIPYEPSQSFLYAFWVGILNTLKIIIVGIILATVLGTLVGLGRISSNWLLRQLMLVYIEGHRNIPLLVLLFIWYRGILTTRFPPVKESIVWPGPIYLNQRGIYLPWPSLAPGGTSFVISIGIAIVLSIVLWQILLQIRIRTGRQTRRGLVALAILILVPATGWLLADGPPLIWEIPVLQTFNFEGGLRMTPEFAALMVGLVMYTAAFIAEVVRGGIQSVDRGQLEAAQALGLSRGQVLRLVIIPQALRVIIPPLISQYLNLTKNSSLAFFIGYPELFSVGRIMINQAGRAVPVFAMIMGSYLVMSLFTSFFLNIYNQRIQFVEA
jgi:general L-amino acid transport system permease protein